MGIRILGALGVVLLGLAFSGCSGGSWTPPAVDRDLPLVLQTTKENYLKGPDFCAMYSKITSKEFGRTIDVPKDYDHPEKGSIGIYAYTMKPFDPAKPSYIFFDGGPGQNTHGMMPDFFGQEMNEIRFDQRGLGCSAPPTWEEYKSASLYSSRNTIRDAEMIRVAYGISTWSVYGVSYGTVPATMYGSVYSHHTKSVVLEGVIGDATMLGDASYKAEKLNLVLQQLTPEQRNGFATLMTETYADGGRTADSQAFQTYMMQFFYWDKGMSKFASQVSTFISADGTILRETLSRLRHRMIERSQKFPRAQQPGAIDKTVQMVIYCKDLIVRENGTSSVYYSPGYGFQVRHWDTKAVDYDCDKAGVSIADEEVFNPKNYKTDVPVYYFQGAHDGATVARGALLNWKSVPQKKSYFMLAVRGGHNPNLTRLESETPSIVSAERELFSDAINGREITQAAIDAVNVVEKYDEPWKLYLASNEIAGLEDYFEGLSVAAGL